MPLIYASKTWKKVIVSFFNNEKMHFVQRGPFAVIVSTVRVFHSEVKIYNGLWLSSKFITYTSLVTLSRHHPRRHEDYMSSVVGLHTCVWRHARPNMAATSPADCECSSAPRAPARTPGGGAARAMDPAIEVVEPSGHPVMNSCRVASVGVIRLFGSHLGKKGGC